MTLDSTIDSSNPQPRHTPNMVKFLHTNAVYDVWQCHHTTERGYTFFSPDHNTYSLIDYFLVAKWLLQRVSRSEIETITWSDHAPTSIFISNPSSPPSYKVWRANMYVMKTSPYTDQLQTQLEEYVDNKIGFRPSYVMDGL